MSDTDDVPSPATTGTGPTRVGPAVAVPRGRRRRGRKRGRVVASSVVAVVAAAAVGVAGFVLVRGVGDSTQSQVRDAVDTFVDALASGDLATLQSSTCGALADFYRDVPPADFAEVHRDAVTDGTVPVVTRIDTVQVTGDTAIAQVTAHPKADPADASPRTFDLERIDGTWKVCDPE